MHYFLIPIAEQVFGIQLDTEGKPVLDSAGNFVPVAAAAPGLLSVELVKQQLTQVTNENLTELRVAITGQNTPPPPTGWPMSNNRSAKRLDAHDLRLDALEQLVPQLLALGTANRDQAQVFTAQLQLAQQASQALEAKQAAYDLRLSATEAKATLTASATEANRLDILKNNAADALRDAQALKDEAAIVAAQATATQAKADAATAQKKADDDAAAVLVVQAQAKAAQDTATAAQQAVTALANRFRSATVTVPRMDLGGSVDVVVLWSTPYADGNYVAIAEPAGLTLLGLDATEVTTARTAATTTFRIKNVLGLTIAAGGTLSVFAYHP